MLIYFLQGSKSQHKYLKKFNNHLNSHRVTCSQYTLLQPNFYLRLHYSTEIVYENVLTKDNVRDEIKGQLANIWVK